MKRTKHTLLILAIFLSTVMLTSGTTWAQRGTVRTDSRILYHGGPVMAGTSPVYVIWYGNWSDSNVPPIITDLVTNLGSSPYFNINTGYADSSGAAPNGALIYAGAAYDAFTHGSTLTDEDLEEIVAEHIAAGSLPLDPNGVYLILASREVSNLRPDGGSTYCTPGALPYHDATVVFATTVKYGFVGSAARCPTTAGPQLLAPGVVPPNGSFEADAMASTIASVLNATVTNPIGTSWYDRYGLQNSDKCAGRFGTTYTTTNGGTANIRLGQRDYLIQQNWVNDRKGRCALSAN